MYGELIRVTTDTGIALQGAIFSKNGRKNEQVILHFHGIWGNFYENPFIDYFAEFYPSQGYDFMSVNTQFHDGGAMTGRFETCVSDIMAWINLTISKYKYKKIILQGHSLGSQQIVYAFSKKKNEKTLRKVVGAILLSPVDNIALYCKKDIRIRDQLIARAKSLAEQGDDTLIPKDIFDMWPLSAGTLLNLIDHNTHSDMFPFRNGSLENTPLAQMDIPIFMGIGSDDITIFPSSEEQRRQLSSLQNIKLSIVKGAPHNFTGYEPPLLAEIKVWLGKINKLRFLRRF